MVVVVGVVGGMVGGGLATAVAEGASPAAAAAAVVVAMATRSGTPIGCGEAGSRCTRPRSGASRNNASFRGTSPTFSTPPLSTRRSTWGGGGGGQQHPRSSCLPSDGADSTPFRATPFFLYPRHSALSHSALTVPPHIHPRYSLTYVPRDEAERHEIQLQERLNDPVKALEGGLEKEHAEAKQAETGSGEEKNEPIDASGHAIQHRRANLARQKRRKKKGDKSAGPKYVEARLPPATADGCHGP